MKARIFEVLLVGLTALVGFDGGTCVDSGVAGVKFLHPLPGACFASQNAATASVSAASGLFEAWSATRGPLQWTLVLNGHESASGDLSTGNSEDGELGCPLHRCAISRES